MDTLPPEILDRIFAELSVPDLLSCRLVNHFWFSVTSSYSHRLLYNLSIAPYATGMSWNTCSSAKTLSLSDYPYEHFLIATNVLSSSSPDLLPFFSRATSLTFVGSEITEDVVGVIVRAAAPNLKSLSLHNCNPCFMSGQVFKCKTNEEKLILPELESLSVEDTRYLSDAILSRVFQSSPRLERLSLRGCHLSSERVVYKRFYPPHLRQSPNESVLTTHMVLKLAREFCPGIKSLNFSRTSANSGFVDALIGDRSSGPEGDRGCEPLLDVEELILDDCYYLVEADVRRVLTTFPNLRVFRAGKVRGVTDAALAATSTKSLSNFSVRDCAGISAESVSSIVALNPGLTTLCVANCSLGSGSDFFPVDSSSSLRFLVDLDVSGMKLSEGDFLNLLKKLRTSCGTRLESLNASRNPGVTDVAVADLVGACPRLKVLRLAHCSQLTDAGLIGLQLDQDDEQQRRTVYGVGRSSGDRSTQFGPQALGFALRPDAEQRLVDESGRQRLLRELLHVERKNAALTDLQRLVVLDLSYSTRVSDLTMQHGLNHPSMESLDISGCALTDDGLKALNTTAKNLCELRLDQCHRLSDRAVMDFISASRRLRRLSLRGMHQLTEDTLSILPSFNFLDQLLQNAGIPFA